MVLLRTVRVQVLLDPAREIVESRLRRDAPADRVVRALEE
jgi:hypothetical protein